MLILWRCWCTRYLRNVPTWWRHLKHIVILLLLVCLQISTAEILKIKLLVIMLLFIVTVCASTKEIVISTRLLIVAPEHIILWRLMHWLTKEILVLWWAIVLLQSNSWSYKSLLWLRLQDRRLLCKKIILHWRLSHWCDKQIRLFLWLNELLGLCLKYRLHRSLLLRLLGRFNSICSEWVIRVVSSRFLDRCHLNFLIC